MIGKQIVATTIGAITVALAGTVLAYSFASELTGPLFAYFFYQTSLFGLTLGLVAIAAARTGTLNFGVWITTLAGFLMTIESTTLVLAGTLLSDQPGVFEALLRSELAPADLPRDVAIVLLFERGWLISLGGFLTLGLLLFPDGALPSRRWWPVTTASVVGLAAYTVSNIIVGLPESTVPFYSTESTGESTDLLMEIGIVLVGLSVLASLISLFARHRHADSEKRHQIRWMLFGAGVFALSFIAAFAYSTAIGDPRVANYATLVAMPVLIGVYGVGIVKYRLYDIDRIISRTVSYALVVGLLGLVILGLVSLLAAFLPSDDPLVVAVSTLAAAALFNPLRRRVQGIIDRRFNRSRYDAQRVIGSFTETLQEQVDPDEVVDGWVEVVEDTMQPSAVGFWVKEL